MEGIKMIVANSIYEIRQIIKDWKRAGLSIGFVPTMGYLHEGHASLIEQARKENDRVVVSIFVNPIQFGPNEDYERYPRDFGRDSKVCQQKGADLIFYPDIKEMYPVKNLCYVDVEMLGDYLCGSKRKGHFRGVCTVVSKLFNIIAPDKAYFGQKDAQQLAIIKRMVKDLNFDIEIIACPTVREEDGLAMSSRNAYLSPEQRKIAPMIFKTLMKAKQLMEKGEKKAISIKNFIADELAKYDDFKIDYVEVVDTDALQPVEEIQSEVLVAVAVYLGSTRLIDNFVFDGG